MIKIGEPKDKYKQNEGCPSLTGFSAGFFFISIQKISPSFFKGRPPRSVHNWYILVKKYEKMEQERDMKKYGETKIGRHSHF